LGAKRGEKSAWKKKNTSRRTREGLRTFSTAKVGKRSFEEKETNSRRKKTEWVGKNLPPKEIKWFSNGEGEPGVSWANSYNIAEMKENLHWAKEKKKKRGGSGNQSQKNRVPTMLKEHPENERRDTTGGGEKKGRSRVCG